MRGLVIGGGKKFFSGRPLGGGGVCVECRLKGKSLKETGRVYNPLAPGDIVLFSPTNCLIESREPRTNKFSRWNEKGRSSQVLAANIGLVLCVTSPLSPPFRPRFIDRVLLQAEAEGLPAAVVLNKCDLALSTEDDLRLRDFERLGYPVFRVSMVSGEGLGRLESFIAGKPALLIGQSGVGKSSILNRLFPTMNRKIGEINKKFDRGSHTTVLSERYENDRFVIIDTPGVRQFIPDGIAAADTALYMKEIAPLTGSCAFGASCTHTHEESCAVRAAVAAGIIHPDRYESFIRLSAG